MLRRTFSLNLQAWLSAALRTSVYHSRSHKYSETVFAIGFYQRTWFDLWAHCYEIKL